MNNEIIEIIQEQSKKLPREVVSYLASSEWDSILGRIAKESNIDDDFESIERATVVVLLGLVHPDAYRGLLRGMLSVQDDAIDAFAIKVNQEIFAAIRPALIDHLNTERAAAEARGEFPPETQTAPGTAPTNIPTEIPEEEKPLIPPIAPKVVTETAAPEAAPVVHPFEEKLRGTIPATITPAATSLAPQTPIPTPTTPARGALAHDPYREPIE